jgi:hypothetical protein
MQVVQLGFADRSGIQHHIVEPIFPDFKMLRPVLVPKPFDLIWLDTAEVFTKVY